MRKAVAMVVLLIGVAFVVQGAADKSANPGLDKLKSLAGKWEGKNPEGKSVRVSYKVVSTGTAVLEALNSSDESDMVTLYTADGDRVALTHYCALGNQPRMKADPQSPANQLHFKFAGGSNLGPAKDKHMHEGTITFIDDDHIEYSGVCWEGGKPAKGHECKMKLVRKK